MIRIRTRGSVASITARVFARERVESLSSTGTRANRTKASMSKRPDAPGPSGSGPKRPRGGADDEDDEFVDAMIDDEEAMLAEEAQEEAPPPEEEEGVVAVLGSKDIKAMAQRWKRPALPNWDPATHEITFQQIEADYTVDAVVPELAGRDFPEARAAVVRMYGVTDDGHSVMAHVHGFCPYFYVRAPPGFQAAHCTQFQQMLSGRLKAQSAKEQLQNPVLRVQPVRKQSIMYYSFGQMGDFLRIVVAQPSMVATCRRILEQGVPVPAGGVHPFETFESNWAYVLRFMVDREITGCSWATLKAGSWRQRPWTTSAGARLDAKSHCQIEVDVRFSDMISHKTDGEYMRIAPLRILSFDIECAGRPGVFPEADKDPVIQIANHVTLQGSSKPIVKNVFTLHECAPISGAQVLSFDSEAEMLKAWRQFLIDTDPDIITGYNIMNFDTPYLIDRAAKLKVNNFPFLGRICNIPSRAKDKLFQSKQVGTRESKEINMEGRVQFDVMQVLQRDYKLASYSLNAVCTHFLGEQKEDVHHSIITELWQGDPQTRRRLAVYCLKDAYLPQRLLEKLMCVINYTEMARVTGVPFSYLITRGQQIKVMSQIYRKCLKENLVVPTAARKASEGEKYEGATVIEPIKGFYTDPIATLDFASLYPSIMMAHNLCYSTLVRRQDVGKLQPDQYGRSPTGDVFMKPEAGKGILPQILDELLTTRKQAKKLLKAETDPFKKAVYDGRQLALKVSANSVYGFTGAQVGQLPCLEISSTVTGYGRMMIESTKQQVESHYNTANGYDHDALVVYGDTDSVMIKFGTDDLKKSMELAEDAATRVTASFIQPIKLEFEKCYHPYLLMNKKRYAGLLWTNPDKYDKMDCKGIETVRRDNCQLVKDVVDTSLRAILIHKDPATAIAFVKGQISQLLMNEMDMSKLVITKALTRTADQYQAGNKQAHVELAAKLKKRDAGSAPNVGDRIPYVMIKGAAGAKAYEKAEDPVHVLEQNIPLDTEWYLEHQLSEPIKRLFEPIVDNTDSLLKGDHTRRIKKVMPSNGSALMGFVKVTRRCLGCKAAIGESAGALCQGCDGKKVEVYLGKLQQLAECEQLFWRLFVAAQRIQGDNLKDVLGIARDSPIYYQMKKVQKDITEHRETLARFDSV